MDPKYCFYYIFNPERNQVKKEKRGRERERERERKRNKFRRRAIFPKDDSLSIFAAITFNSHVRNGMALYYYAIDTEIKSYKLNVA